MGVSGGAIISTILEGVGTAFSGSSLAGSAVQGVAAAGAGALVNKALAPKQPGEQPKTPLPDQGAIDAARKRSLTLQRQRSGRASTILSDPTDTLGG